MKYSFNIDEKSLFVGVKNNFSRGHSATVHTPLNQAANEKNWRNDIYAFLKGYNSIDIDKIPERLKDMCLRNTTSHAKGKITHFFVFSKFLLDGIPFEVDSSFAMYVKEETDEFITNREGDSVANTHKGRQKLHYQKSLIYTSDGYKIDNNKVLDSILEVNGGFAYVVNGFEVDTEEKTLNFKTTMIGLEGVLLSNVFISKKGVGKKLLVDGALLQMGIPHISKGVITNEEKNKFFETLEKIQESSRTNGKIGEEYVVNNIKKILKKDAVTDINHVSKDYPQSPFDIECIVDDKKLYIEVKSTKGEKKEFYMSKGERLFMERYQDNYLLILVTNINTRHKKVSQYRKKEIVNEEIMRQELQGIKFIVK